MADDTPHPNPITVSGLASEPAPHAGSRPRPVEPRLSDERHPSTGSGLTDDEAPPAQAPPQKPYRVRHDGWTAERQNDFIAALGRTGCVRDAARMAGISWNSAYKFRQRDADFAERWERALRRAKTPLEEVAWKRAVEGEKQDVWYHGKVVGQRVKHANDVLRLLIQRDDNGAGRDAQGRFAPAQKTVDGGEIEAHADTAGHIYDPNIDAPKLINGRKAYPQWLATPDPAPGPSKDRLEEKLKAISDRIGEIGSRSINVRTHQGITDEIIDVVQRFVEGGRIMLPERFKWMHPDKFEKAKAEFLAAHPGGAPEEEEPEWE